MSPAVWRRSLAFFPYRCKQARVAFKRSARGPPATWAVPSPFPTLLAGGGARRLGQRLPGWQGQEQAAGAWQRHTVCAAVPPPCLSSRPSTAGSSPLFPFVPADYVLLCPGCWFQAVLPGLASRSCMEINKAFGLATSEWRGWSPQGVPPSLLGQPAAQVVSAGGRRAGRPAVWVATQGVGSGSTCPGQPLAREPTICFCLSVGRAPCFARGGAASCCAGVIGEGKTP